MAKTHEEIAADLLGAFALEQGGKSVEKPSAGPCGVSVRPGMTFHGDPDAVIRDLSRAYPDTKFTFDTPAASTPAEKKKGGPR